jgi:hypothetical protein
MSTTITLPINQAILLLALDEENGKVRWNASPYLDYALAGGLIAELVRQGRVDVGGDGKLVSVSDEPTGSALLDEVARLIRESKERHTAAGWVGEVMILPELAHRQMEELVQRGILQRQKGSFLFFFPSTTYPVQDRTPEKELLWAIREALAGTGPVEPRLAALITIANGAHLLRGLIPDEELDGHQERLEQIAKSRPIAQATCDLIRESERALYVASSIPFMGVPQV